MLTAAKYEVSQSESTQELSAQAAIIPAALIFRFHIGYTIMESVSIRMMPVNCDYATAGFVIQFDAPASGFLVTCSF